MKVVNSKNIPVRIDKDHLVLLAEIQQHTGKSFSQLIHTWITTHYNIINAELHEAGNPIKEHINEESNHTH